MWNNQRVFYPIHSVYISLCLERGYYKQGGPPKVFKQLDSKQFYEQQNIKC